MVKVVVTLAFVFLHTGHSLHPYPGEVCNQRPTHGPCNAQYSRFYFNPDTQTCETFTYGGCGGNANNFQRITDCEKICFPTCAEMSDRGPCRGLINRYFFNPQSQTCEVFIYGGCGGNCNNFINITQCEETCNDVCNLRPETGPCRARVRRFAFDPATQSCRKFIYGGCGGNPNNFKTINACRRKCIPE
ncbi:actinia tenebrosa protease inhibitors-like [Haliotis rufescens]|uniref:actinia tenebrosa protease inhibitors-like n=1 Tax=Haliotis rufescens TaxID=6454 RepID=UPI001EAFEBB8|nr:actinia tenebrosa protease inhibitors-like [Haliotis rufescens]